jgi:hypothetical protein
MTRSGHDFHLRNEPVPDRLPGCRSVFQIEAARALHASAAEIAPGKETPSAHYARGAQCPLLSGIVQEAGSSP